MLVAATKFLAVQAAEGTSHQAVCFKICLWLSVAAVLSVLAVALISWVTVMAVITVVCMVSVLKIIIALAWHEGPLLVLFKWIFW
jgi:hypothetical protein